MATTAGAARLLVVPAGLLLAAGSALALAVATNATTPGDLGPRATTPQTQAAALDPTMLLALPRLSGPPPEAPAGAAARAQHDRASRSDRSPVLPAAPAPAAHVVRPVVGDVTSGFGHRWGRLHAGLDLGAPTGTPVVAVAAGSMESAGFEGGYGNLVTVRHEDGTVTAYAHLSRILIDAGPVGAGDVLGLVGSSGRSTGPHLHFEVRTGSGPVDPLAWLAGQGVDG